MIFFYILSFLCRQLDITASSPYIAQELSLLKKAFNDERNERMQLQASEMKKVLSQLTPIHVPQPKDERINVLEQDLAKVKYVCGNLIIL